ncbi:MAG: DNA polymerase I, partial [Clostridia bacterium]|nr:DNA polymerase I [Clostridia bacterium]
SFNQTETRTGRISSTEPNLQNIPVRTELGREFRRTFTAGEGMLLVDADYSQIELRLLAALSGDEKMIAAFKSGADIHKITASEVFGVPLDEVTPDLRKRAKAVNFGIVYGIGGYSLSGDIGVSVKEAGQYIKRYKETYAGVDAYLQGLIKEAKETGYVKTLYQRRRYIPELTAQKAATRAFGERVAMNSPIQGTAADIIKIAMLRVEKALSEGGYKARLILQVHDELIIEAPEAEAEAVMSLLKHEMEHAVELSVPLTVEVSLGKTWYDCK